MTTEYSAEFLENYKKGRSAQTSHKLVRQANRNNCIHIRVFLLISGLASLTFSFGSKNMFPKILDRSVIPWAGALGLYSPFK